MQNKFKKILIVSSYAPPAIGGPQNLYNLLRDFPIDSYSILTSYYNIDNVSATKGIWLPGEYVFYDNPQAGKEARKNATENKKIESRLSHLIQKLKFLMKRLSIVRALAGLPVIFLQVFAIIRAGKKAVTDKRIDILVGFSDYGPAMLGTFFLHKITKKPYHIFLFDLYRGNFLPFPGQLLASIFERLILTNAQKIIVTNEGTKNLYLKRYGEALANKIVIIYNSVFPESYERKTETPIYNKDQNEHVILFTGRIYWPQIGALRNLIQAVNEIKDEKLKLQIYSPSPKDYLGELGIKESKKVTLDMAPPEEIPDIQKKADLLFLPLSWHTKSQAIIDTATPGKLTDYLIAGKPMLIHAPASSYLVEYAKEKNFALVVDEENIEKLKTKIVKFFKGEIETGTLMENAQATFFENHDANKNAKLFQDLLKN